MEYEITSVALTGDCSGFAVAPIPNLFRPATLAEIQLPIGSTLTLEVQVRRLENANHPTDPCPHPCWLGARDEQLS